MSNATVKCKEYVISYNDGTVEQLFSTNFSNMLKRLRERETVKRIDKVFNRVTYLELVYDSGEKK
jgi:hypothetical protein